MTSKTNQERQACGYFRKANEFAKANNQIKATWYNNAAHRLLAHTRSTLIVVQELS